MIHTDILVEEISSPTHHIHYIAQQPIDRHFSEITDELKTVFINAGIDSTCGKKRASTIHKFVNGTITVLSTAPLGLMPIDNLVNSLTVDHSIDFQNGEESITPVCESDIPISQCCTHCGK